MQKSITVQGESIALIDKNEMNYISLTDIARYKGDAPDMIIQNWMRNRNTIEFLGLWESINSPIFHT